MNARSRVLFNNIIVHVSRTWERIRLEQPFQEMPEDNIESVDSIVHIADRILLDEVIQKFINSGNEWSWSDETDEDYSDTYIEGLASDIILTEFI